MCDKESLRYCKAYLRRRLAYGPPVVEKEEESVEVEGGAAGEQGVSAWGHLWPLGRHVQCEELRRVRKGCTRSLLGWFVHGPFLSRHFFQNSNMLVCLPQVFFGT